MQSRFKLLAFTATLFPAAMVHAQAAGTVTLNATLVEQLSMTASPSIVNFALNNGTTASGSTPIVISTSWLMVSSRSSVKLFGWFTTPAAALTDGAGVPNNIPSSEVMGKVTTGTPTSFTAFTQSNSVGSANGGLLLFTQSLSSTNRLGSRVDNLALEIDLTSQPQLPAGSYSGVLNLQAQAF